MISFFDKKSKDEIALEIEVGDVGFIMSEPQGRAFIYRMLVFAQVFTPMVSKEHGEVLYHAGTKEFPMRILGIILSTYSTFYVKMIEENSVQK